jgi:hypothetical protein
MNKPVMPDVFAEPVRSAPWFTTSTTPTAAPEPRRSPKARLQAVGSVDTFELFDLP